MRSDVGAPGEEEIDHEFHFEVKRERKIAHAFTSVGDGIRKNARDILERREELIAALTGADGAPVDLAAGFKSYVRYDLENDDGYANSELFSQIGSKAIASVKTEAWLDAAGNARSLAQIVADAVILEGKTKVLGSLEVDGNYLKVTSGSLWIPSGIISVGGGSVQSPSAINYLSSTDVYATTLRAGSGGIVFPGESSQTFKPTQVTSLLNPNTKKPIGSVLKKQ